MKVTLAATGVANTASVLAAWARVGATPTLCDDPRDLLDAERVVLPGVGHFGAASVTLRERGVGDAIRERIEAGRPTLTICLGLQLLAAGSEEAPGEPGLGVLDAQVTRFGAHLRVPQMGWNEVRPTAGAVLLQPGWAYYANTYKLDQIPDGWEGAHSDHGGPFVAAIERGPVLACQFHPELSGAWGAALLRRWLEASC